MSIKGIVLDHFSELTQTEINSSTEPCPRHVVFHYFLSDDSKQDSAATTAHSNCLIELLKKLMSTLSTVWENTDGCAEKYRCASALYLMSVLPQRHFFFFFWNARKRHSKKEEKVTLG